MYFSSFPFDFSVVYLTQVGTKNMQKSVSDTLIGPSGAQAYTEFHFLLKTGLNSMTSKKK